MADDRVDEMTVRLGVSPDARDAEDVRDLVAYVMNLGTRVPRARAALVMKRVCLATALVVLAACGGGGQPRAATTSRVSTPSTTTAPSTTTRLISTTTTTIGTTTTAVAPPEPAPARAGKVIVIDPGHNEGNARHTSEINRQVEIGNGRKACDTTGTATNDGYSEASYNTDLANRVAALLRDQGVTVVLTRDASTPFGPCIDQRAAIGNNAHADAAVSIHADGGPADGRGFHVIRPLLVAGHNDGIIEPSQQLALVLRDAYRSATGLPFATYIGHDGLDARDDLGGLNLSTVPKVFIETGNMRNATDAALLADPEFRQRVAEGIARGLLSFVNAR